MKTNEKALEEAIVKVVADLNFGNPLYPQIMILIRAARAHLSALQSPLPDLAGLKLPLPMRPTMLDNSAVWAERTAELDIVKIHNAAIDACIAAIASAGKKG